jgi:hypothetical protein
MLHYFPDLFGEAAAASSVPLPYFKDAAAAVASGDDDSGEGDG